MIMVVYHLSPKKRTTNQKDKRLFKHRCLLALILSTKQHTNVKWCTCVWHNNQFPWCFCCILHTTWNYVLKYRRDFAYKCDVFVATKFPNEFTTKQQFVNFDVFGEWMKVSSFWTAVMMSFFCHNSITFPQQKNFSSDCDNIQLKFCFSWLFVFICWWQRPRWNLSFSY